MQTITNIKGLRKPERLRFLKDHPGVLARIAREIGVSRHTVSRVFHGKIERSPVVEAALNREVAAIFGAPENQALAGAPENKGGQAA